MLDFVSSKADDEKDVSTVSTTCSDFERRSSIGIAEDSLRPLLCPFVIQLRVASRLEYSRIESSANPARTVP